MSTVTAATRPALTSAYRERWSPKQLAEFFGVSRRTIWSWVARRWLPEPHRISRNTVRWTAAEVAAVVERLEARTRSSM